MPFVKPGGLPNKDMLTGDPTAISPGERANADLLMKGRVSPQWRDGFSGDVQRKLRGFNEASKEIKPQGEDSSPKEFDLDRSNAKTNAPGMANEPGYKRGGYVGRSSGGGCSGHVTIEQLRKRHGEGV